ncbi:class II aldolase/adducin family protein [Desulfovibrio sp. ZJ200]|uniref:class II aldolase/adducin family protein n=1 Tax=Desulfovibrio sp. ZJ200 TaxID=2709792 RepID=UPI0013EA0C77|nr:class II aldolase/adducin family protein [Desulfovibrio sp. ZJ200]
MGLIPDFPDLPELAGIVKDMRAICRDAWQQGLLSGCNGNASCRLDGERICVTRSGAAKGRLRAEDCCLVDLRSGRTLAGGPASTELGMHLAIYRALPDCGAVLHTHPRRLLALSLHPGGKTEDFLRLPLFEAETWRARLGCAPALEPGGQALARAVALAAQQRPAVWMAGHGLCCWGKTLADALCMSEELEHLAAVQLLALQHGRQSV